MPNATSQKVCNKLTGTRFKKKMASIAKQKTENGTRIRVMISETAHSESVIK